MQFKQLRLWIKIGDEIKTLLQLQLSLYLSLFSLCLQAAFSKSL
jgi:hypothetical protein